jgi:hypothetical protein
MADVQFFRYLFIKISFHNKPQDLLFPVGKLVNMPVGLLLRHDHRNGMMQVSDTV